MHRASTSERAAGIVPAHPLLIGRSRRRAGPIGANPSEALAGRTERPVRPGTSACSGPQQRVDVRRGRASDAQRLRQVVRDRGDRAPGGGQSTLALGGSRPRPAARPGRRGRATAAAACPGSRPAGRPGAGPWRPRRPTRLDLGDARGTAGPWPRGGARRTAPPGRPTCARTPRRPRRALGAGRPRPAPSPAGPAGATSRRGRRPARSASVSPGRPRRSGRPARPRRRPGPGARRSPPRPCRPSLQGALVVALRDGVPPELAVHAGQRGARRARRRSGARRRVRRGDQRVEDLERPAVPPRRGEADAEQPARRRRPRRSGRRSVAMLDGPSQRLDPGRRAGRGTPRAPRRRAAPGGRRPRQPPHSRSHRQSSAGVGREATVRRAPATVPSGTASTTVVDRARQVREPRWPRAPPGPGPARAAEQDSRTRPDRGQQPRPAAAPPRTRRPPGPRGRPPPRRSARPRRPAPAAGSRPRACGPPPRRSASAAASAMQRQPVVLVLERREQHAAGVWRRPARRRVTSRSASSAHSLSRCSTSTPRPGAAPALADAGEHRDQHVVSRSDDTAAPHRGCRSSCEQASRVQCHRGPSQPARGRRGVAQRHDPAAAGPAGPPRRGPCRGGRVRRAAGRRHPAGPPAGSRAASRPRRQRRRPRASAAASGSAGPGRPPCSGAGCRPRAPVGPMP